ncbi:MAG: hypothetical protein PHI93_10200 [Kiritimatiellae bacterium]|nr:hypothetical protein [Kiritimatiellia bacterium]
MKTITAYIAFIAICASVYAEELNITALHSNGALTWSNRVSNAQYRVEWATTPTNPWQTNAPVFDILSTSNVTSIDVPMYYRVVWVDAPPVRYKTLSDIIPIMNGLSIDLNGDGIGDSGFYSVVYTIPEGGINDQIVTVSGDEIINTPFSYGMMIDSNLTWEPSPQYSAGLPFASRTDLFGSFQSGPWGGITNAYLPVSFLITTNRHYGWIRIEEYEYSMGGEPEYFATNLRLTECAYQSIPDQGILAGQTE